MYLAALLLLFGTLHASCPTIDVFFSHEDNLQKELLKQIDEEKKAIHVATYELELPAIADALIAAKKRGVDVQIITDGHLVQSRLKLFDACAGQQIPVLIWSEAAAKDHEKYRPRMHNKFFIFGREKVWTGSYNLSAQSTYSNAENAILLTDTPTARAFEATFSTLKSQSTPYKP